MQQTPELSFDVIQLIKKVGVLLENSKLDESIMADVKDETKILSEYLDVTEHQTWLFVIVFIILLRQYEAVPNDVVAYLGLEPIDIVDIKMDMNALLEKKLFEVETRSKLKINKMRLNRSPFNIREKVLTAIFNNVNLNDFMKGAELDNFQFFSKVSEFVRTREFDVIDTFTLFEEVESLELNNMHLKFIPQFIHLHLNAEDRLLLYQMGNDMINDVSGTVLESTMCDIYENVKTRISKIREITNKTSLLVQEGLITIMGSKFTKDTRLELSSKCVEMMLGEDAEIFLNKKSNKISLTADLISHKDLFFDQKLEEQITFLKKSLSVDSFEPLQQRLETMKLSKGVAAVFYGLPGTGKTETAMQIAKSSGRDIVVVDISQTKSMWFGESEKIIKDVFQSYSNICSKSKIKPILLINEADAILCTRQTGKSGQLEQTENAIQNIILEEIEKLDGILIATTNLVGNFDPAFERRFLFKIKFENPTEEVKCQIWKNKLEWLTDDDAMALSSQYSFSGGEIDNVVRKAVINEVLNGMQPSIKELIDYCNLEKISNQKVKGKLGF